MTAPPYRRTPYDAPRRCRGCRKAPPEVGPYCQDCHDQREEYRQDALEEARRENAS